MPDTTPAPLSSVLEDMRSRHYRVDAPGLPGYPLQPGESMCDSDHHKWPCHAHILGGAVAAVLGLADRWDRDAYRTAAYAAAGCAEQVREAITRELLGGENSDG